jgi:chromosome partitioning protein
MSHVIACGCAPRQAVIALAPSGGSAPSYFGLVTNRAVGGESQELTDFVSELPGIDTMVLEGLWNNKRAHYKHREAMYEKICSLGLPLLNTEMTAAHKIAIEIYNLEWPFFESYGYFHSFIDVAPASPAAGEIRRLAEELVSWRF